MNNMLRLSTTLCASLLLAACATQSVDPSFRLDPRSADGVVTGSISYAGRFSGYAVHYRHLTTGETGKFQIGQSQALLPITPNSDFDDDSFTGAVFAVQLPPGDYLASRWSVGSGPSIVNPTEPFSIRFKVEPGKMIYIGSFQFTQTSGMGLTVTGATLAYRDAAERDLPTLRHKFPNLASAPVERAIEPGTDIQGVGGLSKGRITVPLFVPGAR